MTAGGEPARSGPEATANLSDRVRSLRLGDRGTTGPTRSSPLPWALVIVCLAMTAAFGYRAYRVGPAPARTEAQASEPTQERREVRSPSTPTDSPSSSVAATGEVTLQSKGYVTPLHLIQVSPKVGGQLLRIAPGFEEGAFFQKGAELAWIEDVDYRAEYEQARAAHEAAIQRFEESKSNRPEEIVQARNDLEEASRSLQQMKIEVERNRRAGTAVALKEIDQARYGAEAMERRIRKLKAGLDLMEKGPREERRLAAEAEVRQTQAAMEKAKWRLDNTVIKAPVSGIILSKKAEEGNIVNPSAFSSGISASLCEMADLRNLEIDLKIQERDVAGVRKDQKCWVMPEAYQNDRGFLAKHPQGYVGYVSRLMPTADRSQGAIPVRVRIPRESLEGEAGVYLRPDMATLVSFLREQYTGKK